MKRYSKRKGGFKVGTIADTAVSCHGFPTQLLLPGCSSEGPYFQQDLVLKSSSDHCSPVLPCTPVLNECRATIVVPVVVEDIGPAKPCCFPAIAPLVLSKNRRTIITPSCKGKGLELIVEDSQVHNQRVNRPIQ